MKHLFLLMFCTISCQLLLAQNYNPINRNRECYFENSNCIRIDSIAVNNADSEFYNYKQISNYQGCFLYSHNSWLGNKRIKKQNNNWQFINYGSDTLTIKPNAAIGAKWYAGSLFTANDSARVDSIYSTTFLGVTDSVKSITIYWYYSNQYNSSQILVSKNYGLIKFLNFNENNNIPAIIGIKNPT